MKDKHGKTLHVGDFVKARLRKHQAPTIGRIAEYKTGRPWDETEFGKYFVLVAVPKIIYGLDMEWFESNEVELTFHPLPEYETSGAAPT